MRDDELDAVLSELTSVDADPRLPERVLRAIDRPRTRVVAWQPLIGAAAAVLLAVSAAIWWRASQPGPLPQPADAPARPVARAVEPAPWETASALGDDVRDEAAEPRARRRAAPAISADDPWPNRLPALARSSPIDVHPIERTALEQPRLSVQPLQIAQLEIDSLER
jgi:hypothetical protein